MDTIHKTFYLLSAPFIVFSILQQTGTDNHPIAVRDGLPHIFFRNASAQIDRGLREMFPHPVHQFKGFPKIPAGQYQAVRTILKGLSGSSLNGKGPSGTPVRS